MATLSLLVTFAPYLKITLLRVKKLSLTPHSKKQKVVATTVIEKTVFSFKIKTNC